MREIHYTLTVTRYTADPDWAYRYEARFPLGGQRVGQVRHVIAAVAWDSLGPAGQAMAPAQIRASLARQMLQATEAVPVLASQHTATYTTRAAEIETLRRRLEVTTEEEQT
jgi:hypothetical protein